MERMAVYAAMVTRLDQGIGSMIAALKKTKTLDNTLICFLSDNGGGAEELGRQMKALHVPKQTRDGDAMVVGNATEKMPGPEDRYQSYGIGWTNASNTPLRLYKHWVHEGGISTPFIAQWPGHIAKPGSLTNQPGHLIDLMTTFMDASKTAYPRTHAGNSILRWKAAACCPRFKAKTPCLAAVCTGSTKATGPSAKAITNWFPSTRAVGSYTIWTTIARSCTTCPAPSLPSWHDWRPTKMPGPNGWAQKRGPPPRERPGSAAC